METNTQYLACLCRTCMNKVEAYSQDGTTIPQKEWLSIFELIEDCAGLRIAEVLSDAVPQIVVQPTDEMPKKICTECLQRLLSVYRFQQMCLQSDKEMHELLSKEQTVLKTPVLEEAIKGETETNGADSQPLKDLPCSSTLQNLQQPSIQEVLAEVTVQTIEPEAAKSSADDNLQENTQLLEHCNDSIGEFGAFIKNEPIEDDDEANSEYSDGDTMHSIISVNKDEPIELEDQQENVYSSRYSCHLCNKSYKQRDTLGAHLKNHKKKANNSKEYSYVCHLCSESYNGQRYLTKHLKLAHSIEPQLTCDVCNKSFASSFGLRLHKRIHTGERPYVCSECGKSFTQQSSLAAHRNIHSRDKPYECPCCPLRFTSKAKMTRHKNSRHEETVERYECDICGKKLSSKSTLVEHKLIHSGEKPHKCDFCEKRFVRHNQLLIHNRTHTGDKRYKCKYCERAYTTSHALLKHSRRHVGANVYRCKFCPLAFPLDSELRLHLTSHKNEDPETRERNMKALEEDEAKLELKFSKENAGRQSTEEPSTDRILAEQRSSHAEDKSYECPYCPLRFKSRSNVSKHKKIHEGIKEHECDICGKRFRQQPDLRRHKRIHSEEKPYKCELCENRFTQMPQLKLHIRTHTGEKPYKCKYCERRFAAPSRLSKHLRTHLGKNIYRCRFCPLAFPSSAEMRLHLSSHKNEDPDVRERNLNALQDEEAKLVLKFSKDRTQGQSKEEQQQQKLSYMEIEQPSTDSILAEQPSSHAKDKPYECPYCPIRFSSASGVWKHKKIHEGIKPHKCSICGKKFRQKYNLSQHKRIHSNEKPHKCDVCEKWFAQSQQLKAHKLNHTGERPYKCKYCESGFASHSQLNYHLRSHLGENIHRCKFCPLAFPSSAEMRLHLASHKNEDVEVRELNLKVLQEEEAKLVLTCSKDNIQRQSKEEQQQQKLYNKEIEQPSSERDEFEEFIKNEPIEDEKPNKDYSDGNTILTTISVTKGVALPIEFEGQQLNETLNEFEEFIKD